MEDDELNTEVAAQQLKFMMGEIEETMKKQHVWKRAECREIDEVHCSSPEEQREFSFTSFKCRDCGMRFEHYYNRETFYQGLRKRNFNGEACVGKYRLINKK